MAIEEKPVVLGAGDPLQVGNDDNGEFQAFGLMNRHQGHCICGLVKLPFALTTADGLEVVNVFDKVANQMCA